MGQRKLTDDEKESVVQAQWYLRRVVNFSGICASILLYDLDLIAQHGTTDGKPYVEPQPEIGEGYRLATEADQERPDIEFFSSIQGDRWVRRASGNQPLLPNYTYRVPVDRIPADEDAKQRPTVMVRDRDDFSWHSAKLIGVVGGSHPFVVERISEARSYRQARFPYPGELP